MLPSNGTSVVSHVNHKVFTWFAISASIWSYDVCHLIFTSEPQESICSYLLYKS